MTFKKYFGLLFLAVVTSCSTDSEEIIPVNETDGLLKIQTMENDTHEMELFSENSGLQEGYNKIMLRLKDKREGEFVPNALIDWKPLMHMETMQHSAPTSGVSKVPASKNLYEGYIIFQMPENRTEHWSLVLNYSIDGEEYRMEERIIVPASEKRKVTVFTGTDGIKYIMALVGPTQPEIATNDIMVGLFKMENMQTFPVVDGFKVLIDPRMPGMGNHSSPNNVPLTQTGEGGMYQGKLNLTMSGYWKINLQLENPEGEVVKGEKIEGPTETSSIFFELEF